MKRGKKKSTVNFSVGIGRGRDVARLEAGDDLLELLLCDKHLEQRHIACQLDTQMFEVPVSELMLLQLQCSDKTVLKSDIRKSVMGPSARNSLSRLPQEGDLPAHYRDLSSS
jgi:hypothetical protein